MRVQETVKLNSVAVYDKDKDGNPLEGKYGPYSRCVIGFTSKKGADVQASMFVKKKDETTVRNWQEGDEITAVFWKNGDWVNFELPNETDLKLAELEKRIEALEVYLKDRDDEDVDPTDIPDFTFDAQENG